MYAQAVHEVMKTVRVDHLRIQRKRRLRICSWRTFRVKRKKPVKTSY